MASLRSINQDDLRNHNLSVVLDSLLRATEPMSRADLAKKTGLTKAAMSVLVSLMLDNEILVEGAPSGQSLYGRPSIPLEIKGGCLCGMGLQANADERAIFARLDELALQQEEALAKKGYVLAGTGLALPGLVTDDMRLLGARNLGWERLDLKQFDVVKRLDPVACNEANAAALAQVPGYATQRKDSGRIKPTDSFLYMSTDVGIGGAVIREGRVVSGDHGFGGELGHVSVDMRGPVCRCGRRGCLEVYAGRRSMVSAAGIASSDAAATRSAIDELIDRWHQRDAQTVAVVEKALEAMVSVIASTINVCDVDVVMLGGLWARFEPELIRRIERMVRPQVLAYPEVEASVLVADIVDRPALMGAAEIGLRRFIDNPLRFMKQN